MIVLPAKLEKDRMDVTMVEAERVLPVKVEIIMVEEPMRGAFMNPIDPVDTVRVEPVRVERVNVLPKRLDAEGKEAIRVEVITVLP